MPNDTANMLTSVEQFKYGLTSRATGNGYENREYMEIRRMLLNDENICHLVPQFIRSCRNTDEFWEFIKAEFSTYSERRLYLAAQFNPIIEAIEQLDKQDKELMNMNAYEMGELIGDGGFGQVYKYHHKLIDMDFALKILNPAFVPEEEKTEYNHRFFREAKILFELDHPNIVKVYDTGTIGGKPFIRMEYIDGYNMDEFMEKYSKVSFDRSLKPIIALLEGLSFAHKKSIIHRDLKPRNYMVTKDGKFKIIDFGISAYTESGKHTKLTKTGEQIAGGLYTDPELIRNPKLKDPRSDIYSVGALWYYLLTGRTPIGSDIKQYLIDCSDATNLQADIIMKCLSHELNNRFSTCDELLLRINPPQANNQSSVISTSANLITEVTRNDMFEYFNELYIHEMDEFYYKRFSGNEETERVFRYYGQKGEIEFLNRIYKLADMPSNDSRAANFEEEILLHRVSNEDWPEYWIFDDERLGLQNGNDET
ncbi:MAG: protein kinase, partial [Dysgonamonadaceae bacterium]|nr:protein kinase [Dysgonamonadaceae bacterium]